jgi:hypothetical protein
MSQPLGVLHTYIYLIKVYIHQLEHKTTSTGSTISTMLTHYYHPPEVLYNSYCSSNINDQIFIELANVLEGSLGNCMSLMVDMKNTGLSNISVVKLK